jgi:hypothetical protein
MQQCKYPISYFILTQDFKLMTSSSYPSKRKKIGLGLSAHSSVPTSQIGGLQTLYYFQGGEEEEEEEEEEEAETMQLLRLGDIRFFPSGERYQLEVRSAFPRVEFANGTS